MNREVNRSLISIIACFLLLVGFASVSVGDGISGSGHSGGISRFHSIVIDGVHFETDFASVFSNGNPAFIDDLFLGQQVFAVVDFETLQALEIHQFDSVRGRVEELTIVDAELGHLKLQVLGQQIITDLDTVMHFSNDDVTSLKPGHWVAVSGVRQTDSVIRATALVHKPEDEELILTGTATDIDSSGATIGNVRVAMPYAADYIAAGWLTEGAAVLVELDDYDTETYGAYSAARAMPVPEELIGFSTSIPVAQVTEDNIRLDGEIQILDRQARLVEVDGIQARLADNVIMHDRRDKIRWFDLAELNSGDLVSISVHSAESELVVDKLLRKKKIKHLLRATIQSAEENVSLNAVFSEFEIKHKLKDVRFNGQKLKDVDQGAMDAYDRGNGVYLELKKSAVDKVRIYGRGFAPGKKGKGAKAEKSWSP